MKILIITLTNIGDVLLTMPAILALMEQYPLAKFSLIVGERAAPLFQEDSRFENVWIWRKKESIFSKAELCWKLLGERFDHIVNFRHPVKETSQNQHRRRRHFEKLIEKKLVPLESLEKISTEKGISIPDQVRTEAIESLKEKGVNVAQPWVLLTPGSLNMTKRWKIEGLALVCQELVNQREMQVLLAGDQSDRERSQSILEKAASSNIFDLCGQTDLLQLAVLIQMARLVVCHDSAPLHMASLFNKPVVAIFGPTDPQKYGPWGKDSRLIQKELFCSPCEKSLCVYHHECMDQIQSEEVLGLIDELLKETA